MKIAIVKLSSMGDVVHSMIVIQLIKKQLPNANIDWIVESDFRELLTLNPQINMIHAVNFREVKKKKSLLLLIKEFRRLRKFGSYDLVIDLQGLLKSAIVARIVGSTNIIGFDRDSARESSAAMLYTKHFKMSYSENVVKRNLSLVSFALNIDNALKLMQEKESFLYPSKNYESDLFSKTRKNILLVPGASFSAKRYPAIKFAEISKKINANFFILWGTREEKKLADKIKSFSPNTHVLEKMNIDSLISFISKIDLLIGSDTGPSHIAWALNIPSIILFGPTLGKRNSVSTKINRFIESDSRVNPMKINKNDVSIETIETIEIIKISEELFKIA